MPPTYVKDDRRRGRLVSTQGRIVIRTYGVEVLDLGSSATASCHSEELATKYLAVGNSGDTSLRAQNDSLIDTR